MSAQLENSDQSKKVNENLSNDIKDNAEKSVITHPNPKIEYPFDDLTEIYKSVLMRNQYFNSDDELQMKESILFGSFELLKLFVTFLKQNKLVDIENNFEHEIKQILENLNQQDKKYFAHMSSLAFRHAKVNEMIDYKQQHKQRLTTHELAFQNYRQELKCLNDKIRNNQIDGCLHTKHLYHFEDWMQLFDALCSNSSLTELQLNDEQGQNLGVFGMQALVFALKKSSINTLSLKRAEFSPTALKVLFESLAQKPNDCSMNTLNIISLDLTEMYFISHQYYNIENEQDYKISAENIAKILENNNTLRVLKLCGDELDQGIKPILQAMEKNTTLLDLQLGEQVQNTKKSKNESEQDFLPEPKNLDVQKFLAENTAAIKKINEFLERNRKINALELLKNKLAECLPCYQQTPALWNNTLGDYIFDDQEAIRWLKASMTTTVVSPNPDITCDNNNKRS